MHLVKNKSFFKIPVYVPIELLNQTKILSFVETYISAIENKDIVHFMKLHDKNNKFFLIEQSRWFDKITNKYDGNNYRICKIEIKNKNSQLYMNIFLSISSEHLPEKIINGNYLLNTNEKKICIQGAVLETLTTHSEYSILYAQSLRNEAKKASLLIKNIVYFFNKNLSHTYKLNALNIMLFDSSSLLSFTVPTHSTFGWFEVNESIKIFIPQSIEYGDMYLCKILLHEMTHLFLTETSNNNLSLCFQEGFATYIEENHEIILGKRTKSITSKDYFERIMFSKNMLINGEKSILTLIDLMSLSENDGTELYHQGFLWTYYLIEVYGLRHFLNFVQSLKEFNKNDDPISVSTDLINQRTLEKIHVFYKEEVTSSSKILSFYT